MSPPAKPAAPVKNPVIDVDAALDEDVKREAANMEMRAAFAEIEARQYEILEQIQPGRDDVADWRKRFGGIAADRRRRADGIRARAGVKDVAELPGVAQLVPMVAERLAAAQRAQLLLDEKEANLELYALTPDEVELELVRSGAMQDPSVPRPESASQIKLNAAQGRAQVQALVEWLEGHRPAQDLEDANDPIRQRGVDAARKFYGMTEPKTEPSAEG